MTFDLHIWGGDNNSGSDPSADAVDHWLDEALRAVPLPDGFFARLSRLADAPPERADERDLDGPIAPTRGLSGRSWRCEASNREIWPR